MASIAFRSSLVQDRSWQTASMAADIAPRISMPMRGCWLAMASRVITGSLPVMDLACGYFTHASMALSSSS